jgi:lipid II:glycine glycyltransferase (peptidoglycan interpeptide bridge formation enzyme)
MLHRDNEFFNVTTKHWQIRPVLKNEWDEYWSACATPNLLQSWGYGHAKGVIGLCKPRRFVISNENNRPIALVQVLTWGLPILGGIARVNRGPLLLINESVDEVQLKIDVLSVLMQEARRQRWWFIQIAPEISDSELACQGLLDLGLRKQADAAWASGLIDLSLSEQELYARLNRRWQRTLKKASNLGVIVKVVKFTDEMLADVLKSYADLQKRNEFEGVDSALIKEMSKYQSADCLFDLYIAELVNNSGLNETLGYRLIIRSGCTALDFLVSTNERGRELDANSSLYWHAIIQAKENGCRWFDIGGVNENTTKGIAEFKQGLNAVPYKLLGEWRKWWYS